MKSQGYVLNSELDKGLKKYGEENNLSPSFIINDLVESFLIDNDYLCIKLPENDNESKPEKIKNAPFSKTDNRYRIRKNINNKTYNYASVPVWEGRVAKEIVGFLKSKNWDIKYSIKSTGLKGRDQINYLLGEMEKEEDL